MKEQILKLKEEGKSYSQIQKILNCSKSTISYHCGEGQKIKTRERTKGRRTSNSLIQRVENFKYSRKNIVESVRKFQKRGEDVCKPFNYRDVINKFGENTVCYLSGTPLNLRGNEYQLDHIIPVTRGGDNSLDNMGILHKDINRMKCDLTNEELIDFCIKILLHQGYTVT